MDNRSPKEKAFAWLRDHPGIDDCVRIAFNARIIPLYPIIALSSAAIGGSLFSDRREDQTMREAWANFSNGVEALLSNHWFLAAYLIAAFYAIFWAARDVSRKKASEDLLRTKQDEVRRAEALGEKQRIVRPLLILAKQYQESREARELAHFIAQQQTLFAQEKSRFNDDFEDGARISPDHRGPHCGSITLPNFIAVELKAQDLHLTGQRPYITSEVDPRSGQKLPVFRTKDNGKFLEDWLQNFRKWEQLIAALKDDLARAEATIKMRDEEVRNGIKEFEDEFGRI